MACVSIPVGSKDGGVAVGVGVAHCVPHPPGQSPGQYRTSPVLQGGGVQVTTGVSVGVWGVGVEVGVAWGGDVEVGDGVIVGWDGVDEAASPSEVGDVCATSDGSGADCEAVTRLMVTGVDRPSAPWVSNALTTMSYVPGSSLCQVCRTM